MENPGRRRASLEAGRIALASLILQWVRLSDLSYRVIAQISELASGEALVSPHLLSNASKVSRGEFGKWYPRAEFFVGLEDVSRFLAEVNRTGVLPPLPAGLTPQDLLGREGLLDDDGSILTAADLFAIFIGDRQPPGRVTLPPLLLSELAPGLGCFLESVLMERGLSPIRNIGALLELYDGDPEQLQAVIQDRAVFPTEELPQILPLLAIALSRLTGELWTVDSIAEAVQQQSLVGVG